MKLFAAAVDRATICLAPWKLWAKDIVSNEKFWEGSWLEGHFFPSPEGIYRSKHQVALTLCHLSKLLFWNCSTDRTIREFKRPALALWQCDHLPLHETLSCSKSTHCVSFSLGSSLPLGNYFPKQHFLLKRSNIVYHRIIFHSTFSESSISLLLLYSASKHTHISVPYLQLQTGCLLLDFLPFPNQHF